MFRRPQFADAVSWLLFLGVGVLTAEAQQQPEQFALGEHEWSHQLLTRTPFAVDPTGTRGAKTLQ